MPRYPVIDYLGDAESPVLVKVLGSGGTPLRFGSARARKPAVCAASGREIKVGETLWRPLTNGDERMVRLHPDHVLRAVRDLDLLRAAARRAGADPEPS